jgi:hypothetical protein
MPELTMNNWLEEHRDALVVALAAALLVAIILLILNWRQGPDPLEISSPDSPAARAHRLPPHHHLSSAG